MKEKIKPVVIKKLSITALLTATRLGREEEIRNSLTQDGLPKNSSKTTDYIVLQTAAKKNHKNIVQILLDAGCRVNPIASDCGFTPLAYAVKNENEEIATLLLDKGADVNSGDLTALHLAAQHKSLAMMLLLLGYNVDVNCVRENQTAFQMFFDSSIPFSQLDFEDSREMFKLFVLNGASLHIDHDWTVLHFVATTPYKNIIKDVLEVTSNVNKCTKEGNTSLHHLLQVDRLDENSMADVVGLFILRGAKVDIANNDGITACHLAASMRYLKVLEAFIQFCQWDVNHCDSEGNTTLHILLDKSSSFRADCVFHRVITSIMAMESFKFVQNNSGKFPIHVAIENDQRIMVKDMLLKPGIDVNLTDKRLGNYTILHLYLKKLVDSNVEPDEIDIDIITRLMSLGAQADIVNDEESRITSMHFALMLKNKDILQLLLDNFNFEKFNNDQKKSILHLLIHNIDYTSDPPHSQELQAVQVAELCIKKGANVNARDEFFRTPLPAAALRRQKYMVKTLLENGASFDDFIVTFILDSLMEHEFVQFTYFPGHDLPCDLSMEIIDVAGDITKDIEILEMLASNGMSLEKKSSRGLTILHYAAVNKYTDMLSKLLRYCKDVNVRDPNENTVLHTILNSYINTDEDEKKKLLEIVSALTLKGALVSTPNGKGETPLHLAVKNKHLEISQTLLEYGADPRALDNNGNSVLHFLSMLNYETKANIETDLITLFVGLNCDINAKNKENTTPLLMAAQSGCSLVTRVLLQYGAKIDCTVDECSSTLLQVATVNNHPGVVQELIKAGADVNATRKDGITALHLSVCHKESDITRLLLDNGADSEVRDNNKRTALHCACWYNSSENVNELLIHGADINAEDKFEVIPILLTQRSMDAWGMIYHHAIKLQAANLMICDAMKKYMAEYEQANPTDPTVPNANDFFNVASEEVSRMKEILIDNDFNLSDVLDMSPRHLCRFNNNANFQELLQSHEFEQKFPVYGNLIRASYRKNVVRNGLSALAKDAFGIIIGFSLEESCCDKIFEYLSSQDLRQLDKASRIKFTKRKRVEEDVCTASPPKKRRRASF